MINHSFYFKTGKECAFRHVQISTFAHAVVQLHGLCPAGAMLFQSMTLALQWSP